MSNSDSTNVTKIIILDFDDTIVNFHSHNALVYAGIDDKDIQQIEQKMQVLLKEKGFINKTALEAFLTDAHNKGYKIAIASFNQYPHAIKYAFDQLEISSELRSQIYVEAWLPTNQTMYGKNEHITKIIDYFKLDEIRPENIILLDDSSNNIDKAKEAKYTGILVKKSDDQAQYFKEAIPDFELPRQKWLQKLFDNKYFSIILKALATIGIITGVYYLFRDKFSSNIINDSNITNVNNPPIPNCPTLDVSTSVSAVDRLATIKSTGQSLKP